METGGVKSGCGFRTDFRNWRALHRQSAKKPTPQRASPADRYPGRRVSICLPGYFSFYSAGVGGKAVPNEQFTKFLRISECWMLLSRMWMKSVFWTCNLRLRSASDLAPSRILRKKRFEN